MQAAVDSTWKAEERIEIQGCSPARPERTQRPSAGTRRAVSRMKYRNSDIYTYVT